LHWHPLCFRRDGCLDALRRLLAEARTAISNGQRAKAVRRWLSKAFLLRSAPDIIPKALLGGRGSEGAACGAGQDARRSAGIDHCGKVRVGVDLVVMVHKSNSVT